AAPPFTRTHLWTDRNTPDRLQARFRTRRSPTPVDGTSGIQEWLRGFKLLEPFEEFVDLLLCLPGIDPLGALANLFLLFLGSFQLFLPRQIAHPEPPSPSG